MPTIDLNADLGESFAAWRMGDDEALLDVVTSANVACGFHAGDPEVLVTTCQSAARRGVSVGAHVAYRDLAGFGRTFIDVPADRLRAEVLYQLGAIDLACRVGGARLGYVKPHGALYNAIVHHEAQAAAVVGAIVEANRVRDAPLALLGMRGVALDLAAAAGVLVVHEAFVDRAVRADGTLVPRGTPGAVLNDPVQVAERAVRMVTEGTVLAVGGTEVAVTARSLCVHGDSPGAVEMARAVRDALTAAGVVLAPFVT